jgi:hypothetical protein
MSQTDIYNRITRIITMNFSIYHRGDLFKAKLTNDLGLSPWEQNLLLYHVEHDFNIDLKSGIENDLRSVNQLVKVVSNELALKRQLVS